MKSLILPKENQSQMHSQVEVLQAEVEFKAANPSGVISKEKFILSMEVTNHQCSLVCLAKIFL